MDNYLLRINDIINNKLYLIARNPNILGFGLSNKVINGKMTNIPALSFLVKNKLPLDNLNVQNRIPAKLLGVYTDVINANIKNIRFRPNVTQKYVRPAPGGVLIGTELNRDGGTLGYPVIDKQKKVYILSGPGVMSNDFIGKPNLTVFQPAKYGNYTPDLDKIATFERSINLKVLDDTLDTNPKYNNLIAGEIAYVGMLSPYLLNRFIKPQLNDTEKTVITKSKITRLKQNDPVKFVSANSGVVTGLVLTTPFTLRCRITHKNVLNKQLIITNAVQINCPEHVELTPSDVGAIVVDAKEPNKAVGLLVAGLGRAGVYCHIDKVLQALKVDWLIQ